MKRKGVPTDCNSRAKHPALCLVQRDHHRSDGYCYSSWGFCSVGCTPAGSQRALPGAEVRDLCRMCLYTVLAVHLILWVVALPPGSLMYATCLACEALEFVASVLTWNSAKASWGRVALTDSFMEHLPCASTAVTDDHKCLKEHV